MAVRKGKEVREKVQGYGACLACKIKRLQLLISQIFGAKWRGSCGESGKVKRKPAKGKTICLKLVKTEVLHTKLGSLEGRREAREEA